MADLFIEPPRSSAVASREPQTRYPIRDSSGTLIATHVRRDGPDGKRVHWEREGKPGLAGLHAASLPLYGSELVAATPLSDLVFLVEGEKAADALRAHGFNAVATVCGAGGCPDLLVLDVLAGRDVIQWPDNDGPGTGHMRAIARLLTSGIARRVRVFEWAEGPIAGDAWDYFAHGGTASSLRTELAQATPAAEWVRRKDALHGKPSHQDVTDVAIVTRFSEIEAQDVMWLWPGRIPLGMLTVLDGDPGLGKSTMMLDIAARLSRGDGMPDSTPGPVPAGVVILSAEDDPARVIRPRLDSAGADLGRIANVMLRGTQGERRDPTICATDLAAVEQAVRQVSAGLVVVDPLMAYLPAEVNAHRDQDVRHALRLLSGLAERTGAAVVVIRHLNKSAGGNALYRGGGSIGIIGAARSGLVLAGDPDEPDARVLAMMKSNLAAPAPALRLRLLVEPGASYPRVRWEGESDHTAASLLAVPADPEERSALDEAADLLRELLADGPAQERDVRTAAARANVKPATLRRAKKRLRVISERLGPAGLGGHWSWRLPKDAQDEPSPNDEHLSPSTGCKTLCERHAVKGAHAPDSEHPGVDGLKATGADDEPLGTDLAALTAFLTEGRS